MNAQFLRADDIHARVGTAWPEVLAQLGIAPEFLRRKKAGPCPACGGRDRYMFDNRRGRGDFFCRQCGAGDGFALLQRVHGWPFPEARKRVMEAAGLISAAAQREPLPPVAPTSSIARVASPTTRVLRLRGEACDVADCPDAVAYLEGRGIWPLPAGCTLRAHPSVPYFESGQQIGRFAALLANVIDASGDLTTLHVTYLKDGRKLTAYEPRKLLSPLTGREGCAVRLMPMTGDALGIAEGIETALAASALDGVPVWAALNTSLLAKFEPPPGVARLALYADRDEAGLVAALKLSERVQGRIRIQVRMPTAPAKDFNDVLQSRGSHP